MPDYFSLVLGLISAMGLIVAVIVIHHKIWMYNRRKKFRAEMKEKMQRFERAVDALKNSIDRRRHL